MKIFRIPKKPIFLLYRITERLNIMYNDQNRPLVSVIIISHNDEEHIETAIQSVCDQTVRDIEIICVDDGSIDTTYKRMLRFADFDERVKVIHQENRGTLAARFTGLKHVSSAYTIFLDSDDTLLPEAVETTYNAAESSGADVLEFGVIAVRDTICPPLDEVWNHLNSFFSQNTPIISETNGPNLINSCFNGKANNWGSTYKLYQTELLRKALQYYQGEWVCFCEDMLITLMVLCNAKHYLQIRTKLYKYSVGGGESTRKGKLTPSAVKNASMAWNSLALARVWLNKLGYPLSKISSAMTVYKETVQEITIQNFSESCPSCYRTEFLNWLSECCSKEEIFDLVSISTNRQQEQIQHQQEQIQHQQEQITLLKQTNQQLQENYNSISNAFFWKISKPFRVLLDTLKKLFKS